MSVSKGQEYEKRCNLLSDEVQNLRLNNSKLLVEIDTLKK